MADVYGSIELLVILILFSNFTAASWYTTYQQFQETADAYTITANFYEAGNPATNAYDENYSTYANASGASSYGQFRMTTNKPLGAQRIGSTMGVRVYDHSFGEFVARSYQIPVTCWDDNVSSVSYQWREEIATDAQGNKNAYVWCRPGASPVLLETLGRNIYTGSQYEEFYDWNITFANYTTLSTVFNTTAKQNMTLTITMNYSCGNITEGGCDLGSPVNDSVCSLLFNSITYVLDYNNTTKLHSKVISTDSLNGSYAWIANCSHIDYQPQESLGSLNISASESNLNVSVNNSVKQNSSIFISANYSCGASTWDNCNVGSPINDSVCSFLINETSYILDYNLTSGFHEKVISSDSLNGSYNWTLNCTKIYYLPKSVSGSTNISLYNTQLSYIVPTLVEYGSDFKVFFNYSCDNIVEDCLSTNPVLDANCTFTILSGPVLLDYNATSKYYETLLTATSPGNASWSGVCSKQYHSSQTVLGSILVFVPPPEPGLNLTMHLAGDGLGFMFDSVTVPIIGLLLGVGVAGGVLMIFKSIKNTIQSD